VHKASYDEMERRLAEVLLSLPAGAVVVDIGSQNINGSYRPLIPEPYRYIGVDRVAGRNVDIVMTAEYETGLTDGAVDLVISGQCLEHVRNPFRMMAEIDRILKPGGLVIIAAPFQFPEHRFPVDCWRFLPDGMRAMFDEAGLECTEAYLSGIDCWGIGRRAVGND